MPAVCPALLQNGGCSNHSCSFEHNKYVCYICTIVCRGRKDWASHIRGRQHRQNSEGNSTLTSRCIVCDRDIAEGDHGWQVHSESQAHSRRLRLAEQSGNAPRAIRVAPQNRIICPICEVEYLVDKHPAHIDSAFHRKKERLTAFKATVSGVGQDQYGVTVSHVDGVDFGFVELATLQTYPTLTADIIVTFSGSSPVKLIGIRVSSNVGTNTFIPESK